MPSVSVRYIVDDVDAAIRFYVDRLGFDEVMHPAPTFAMLARGDLRLVLSKPGGGPGGGASMPDGSVPTPGGWNRFAIEVDDIDARYADLTAAGVNAAQRRARRRRGATGDRRRPVREPGRALPADDRRGAPRPLTHGGPEPRRVSRSGA